MIWKHAARLILPLLFASFMAHADLVEGDFNYTVGIGADITITLYTGATNTSVNIPALIDGKPVRYMTSTAFRNKSNITNFVTPDTLLSIPASAFDGCSSLASIFLGGGLNAMDNTAFSTCTNLTSITVHSTNATFSSKNDVLFNKAATRLLYYPLGRVGAYSPPAGTLVIAESAFAGHPNLTRITLPDSTVNIEPMAFSSCPQLQSAELGNGLTNISEYAFLGCLSLSNIALGPNLKTIGAAAFAGCTALTRVVFPASLVTIADFAFSDASDILNLYFLGSPPTANEGAFAEIASGARVYYVNPTGWGPTYSDASIPTAHWNPTIQVIPQLVMITGTPDIPVRVEYTTNLTRGVWSELYTASLTGGSANIDHTSSTNLATLFYRVISP